MCRLRRLRRLLHGLLRSRSRECDDCEDQ